ncbi:MAG: peptidoglycan DD-metalloendopeptidase family protein [bacterium]
MKSTSRRRREVLTVDACSLTGASCGHRRSWIFLLLPLWCACASIAATPAEMAARFIQQEDQGPDLNRMMAAVTNPACFAEMEPRLPRYHFAGLTSNTVALLENSGPAVRRAGVIALIHQNATLPDVRARVAARLADDDAAVREAAAEYMVWHGTGDDVTVLRAAVASGQDPFTLAAITAAEGLIARRERQVAENAGPAWNNNSTSNSAFQPPRTYAEALALVTNRAGPRCVDAAANFYRNRDAFEPMRRFNGRLPETEDVLEKLRRATLAAELFGFTRTDEMGDEERAGDVPVARDFMAPLRDFFEPESKSFGMKMGGGGGPFSDSVHVGYDVDWQRDNLTVVAVADGVVRRAVYNQTWGHIVIIEHRLPDDSWICSLYGHLSPALTVRPGELVRKGQRVGSLGRTFTWENGGYWSHLHFGMRKGEFGAARWIAGYYPTKIWNEGKHGWVDPQVFIREHSPGATASSLAGGASTQVVEAADSARCAPGGTNAQPKGPTPPVLP